MTEKKRYVFLVGGSGSEGETGTSWKWNNKGNHYVLIYLYRNKTAVWLSVAKRCKSTKPHMSMEHHKRFYINYRDCSYWLLTHVNTALYVRAHKSQ
jgi:hypothetical protein